MDLVVECSFCAAHHLPSHAGVCRRLHGHQYKLMVTVTAPPNAASGMIIDFEDLKQVVLKEAVELVDHQDLNDFVPNPTAENLVIFFWNKLKPKLPGLCELRLYETPEFSVIYRGT